MITRPRRAGAIVIANTHRLASNKALILSGVEEETATPVRLHQAKLGDAQRLLLLVEVIGLNDGPEHFEDLPYYVPDYDYADELEHMRLLFVGLVRI